MPDKLKDLIPGGAQYKTLEEALQGKSLRIAIEHNPSEPETINVTIDHDGQRISTDTYYCSMAEALADIVTSAQD